MRAINEDDVIKMLSDGWRSGKYPSASTVRSLPTIEPERKTGKWYKSKGMMPPEYAGVYRCSECEEIAPRDWKHHRQLLSDFCPNCGSYNGESEYGDE